MSSDNRICILQTSWGQWAVWHGSASFDYCEAPSGASYHETEDEAFAAAYRLEEQIDPLEYGVHLISVAEQRLGLFQTIRDNLDRLDLLLSTGKQFPGHDETRKS